VDGCFECPAAYKLYKPVHSILSQIVVSMKPTHSALCRDKSNPFADSNMCSQNGNAQISFGQY
ncbi:hypothetical protein MKW94_005126, partial [Papaver nudicaule]|nr:hypothetical protein [Papaver nudicaule]